MKDYALAESCGQFTQNNPVIDKLLEDKAVRKAMNDIFNHLTKTLTNIMVEVAKKKHLDVEGLLTGETIVSYELKFKKPTTDELVKHLLEKLEDEEGEE